MKTKHKDFELDLKKALASFKTDLPDTAFQRGYLAALVWVAEELGLAVEAAEGERIWQTAAKTKNKPQRKQPKSTTTKR